MVLLVMLLQKLMKVVCQDFLTIFDLTVVKMVLGSTNVFAQSVEPKCSFRKEKILALEM